MLFSRMYVPTLVRIYEHTHDTKMSQAERVHVDEGIVEEWFSMWWCGGDVDDDDDASSKYRKDGESETPPRPL